MKRTPLRRKTQLQTKSTLKTSKPLKRKTRINPRRSKPRKGRVHDDDFLDFVRQQRCMVPGCNKRAEPHHFGRRGMSQKCSDYETVPACREHHRYFHDHGYLPGMDRKQTFDAFRAQSAELLERYSMIW